MATDWLHELRENEELRIIKFADLSDWKLLVLSTEIEKSEGAIGLGGKDDEFCFGFVEFETLMGHATFKCLFSSQLVL